MAAECCCYSLVEPKSPGAVEEKKRTEEKSYWYLQGNVTSPRIPV